MENSAQTSSTPKPKKKKRSFPTAFTVLFIILILAALLTYLVPAGSFDHLTYQPDQDNFLVSKVDGQEESLPANQATLDKYYISIPLENFQNGSILKPVSIPNTYQTLPSRPQGIIPIIMSSITGLADSIGIVTFVLILGGIIGILNQTGAFAAGMAALSRKTKGKEFILVAIISAIIAVGGTTFGMAEETIAFYPILTPIFMAAGFDALVAVAAIYLGSAIGTMFSTVNPFAIVIASNAAGINFKEGLTFRLLGLVLAMAIALIYLYRYAKKVRQNPEASLIAEDMPAIKAKFLDQSADKDLSFDWRKTSSLTVFALAFIVMIWGVVSQGWWFEEMSALFLGVSIILMGLSGLSEKEAVNTFIDGAADLVGVALIIGVARGINIILDDGMISDTLLNGASQLISGMSGIIFSSVQMILFSFLGIFIPSSSGLAALSMPIIAPLADVVNVSRSIVVSAYSYGQGLMSFITPTGLILASLEMVDVGYDKWLKFILPLMGLIGILAILILALEVVF